MWREWLRCSKSADLIFPTSAPVPNQTTTETKRSVAVFLFSLWFSLSSHSPTRGFRLFVLFHCSGFCCKSCCSESFLLFASFCFCSAGATFSYFFFFPISLKSTSLLQGLHCTSAVTGRHIVNLFLCCWTSIRCWRGTAVIAEQPPKSRTLAVPGPKECLYTWALFSPHGTSVWSMMFLLSDDVSLNALTRGYIFLWVFYYLFFFRENKCSETRRFKRI